MKGILLGLLLVPILAFSQVQIIPQPIKVEMQEGSLSVSSFGPLRFDLPKMTGEQDPMSEINHALDWFNEQVTNHLNIEMGVVGGTERSFRIDSTMEEEAYTLEISESGIAISAGGGKGAFYALTSLYQMMAASDEGTLPAVRIEDAPRFDWRGMHLDVARHFFSVEEVKRYIDYLALYKMNTFHWHLTEDQGWRIEIKQYPKLTEIGAWRKGTMVGHYRDQTWDTVRYGGFYTQEDIKEVVAYAQKRFITVVPEIEMPGHSLAALAAYPELACTDGPFEVGTSWGVYEDVYCPKEETFTFLENVLLEVMELFPSEYIHIGGDEVPKKRWQECAYCQELMVREGLANEEELQSWFIQRIERFLNSHGRQIIGWDEILEGGLAPNAAVMSWRGTQGGIEAAKEQHKVVMSPGSPCYFDHYQVQPTDQEPIAIGGFNPLDKVYAYEPVPAELAPEEAEYIMGAQGNVWTEYMKTFEHVEYMALPRMAALAEVLWTPPAQKDYKGFLERLHSNTRILDYRGTNYARHFLKEMD